MISLFVVAPGLLGGVSLAAYWRKARVGVECRENIECRSDKCLRWGGEPIFGLSTLEAVGVCTDDCRSDRGCPQSMRCGDAVSTERMKVHYFPFAPSAETKPNTRVCIPNTTR